MCVCVWVDMKIVRGAVWGGRRRWILWRFSLAICVSLCSCFWRMVLVPRFFFPFFLFFAFYLRKNVRCHNYICQTKRSRCIIWMKCVFGMVETMRLWAMRARACMMWCMGWVFSDFCVTHTINEQTKFYDILWAMGEREHIWMLTGWKGYEKLFFGVVIVDVVVVV